MAAAKLCDKTIAFGWVFKHDLNDFTGEVGVLKPDQPNVPNFATVFFKPFHDGKNGLVCDERHHMTGSSAFRRSGPWQTPSVASSLPTPFESVVRHFECLCQIET